jgi:hypothetical protein
MRLSGKLPHSLWREIISTAVYLYNQTPREGPDSKSPYKTFHDITMPAEGVTGLRKPLTNYLKAYGCRAYVLIKSAGDPDKPRKRQKLQPKAHIGFLVGYESTNIYRIWIPHKKKVISVRDVLFDEEERYDGKLIRFTDTLINKLDEAITKVAVTPNKDLNDVQLREDDSEFKDLEGILDINDTEDVEGEPEVEMAEREPFEIAPEPEPYPTPKPSVKSSYLIWLDLAMPVKSEEVKPAADMAVLPDRIPDLPGIPDYEPAIVDEIRRQNEDPTGTRPGHVRPPRVAVRPH